VLHAPPSSELFDEACGRLARRRPTRRERTVALADVPAAIRAARDAGIRALAIGVRAHVALEADGSVDGLDDLTVVQIAALTGVAAMERPA
jgi:beta-phosphoglucomutase-like phosphatase (HAD superfamily)